MAFEYPTSLSGSILSIFEPTNVQVHGVYFPMMALDLDALEIRIVLHNLCKSCFILFVKLLESPAYDEPPSCGPPTAVERSNAT